MERVVRVTAGAVVIGPTGHIIVVNQNNDSWSLPKGGVDPGETLEQAMRREVIEESGVTQLEIVKQLSTYDRNKIGKGGHGEDLSKPLKRITMFLCTTEQTQLDPSDPGNPEARWVDVEEVTGYLHAAKDIEFFESIKPDIYAALEQQNITY